MAKIEEVTNSNQKPYGKIILSLQNCLLPADKLTETPSKADGLDGDMETDFRILGCELIQTAGILLRLPQVAMATSQVLFQRFFYSKSFVKHSMETVAMGCVCLASKIEEAPRRIRDVINVFHHIKQVRSKKPVQPMILDQNYINLKNQVIKAERRVLKELGFCVHVKHPHKIIVLYLRVLECEVMDTDDKIDPEIRDRNRRLMQTSWNYMNDSLRTDVFLRYHPETVACACIYLSARQLKVPLPNKPAWYLVFGVTEEEIKDICCTILQLYARKKPDYESIEKVIEDIRKQQLEAKLKAKGLSGNNTPQAANFSPSSRPVSPRQTKTSPEAKDKNRNDRKTNSDRSPKNRDTNHVKKRSHSPESSKSGGPNSHSSHSGTPSPKRKSRTPPRGYKDSRKSPSLSRSRSRSNDRVAKDNNSSGVKHRSHHKRRRSHSGSRSYSRSPHRSSMVSKKGHHNKESKNRYKSRSRSRDRGRDRNHRDHSRSRSRSYDKYGKSRKNRPNARDNRHRSRSRERGRR